jgi:hypothetical protein
MNDPAATTQAPESMEEVIEVDNHPTLLELDVGFHKMMNAIDTKESLTRKEWMGYYEYGSLQSSSITFLNNQYY